MSQQLSIEGLDAGYGPISVLHDVSLHVSTGKIVTLVGPNGAGKTTLIRAISRLIPSRGKICFDGTELGSLNPHEVVRKGVVQCADDRKLFPYMSVYSNLIMGAYLRHDRKAVERDLEHVYGLFPILAERSAQQAGTLSGGEQQMASIGRALMAQPQLLLLDEPSFGIAPIMVDRIFEGITQLNAEGLSVLLVEQNVSIALEISSWAYVLENGRVVLSGPSDEVADNEAVHKAYLGL